MDTKYLEYALADRRFYDRPHQDQTQRLSANVRRYELTDLESDVEWKSVESHGWQHHQPSLSVKLPDQGWKIHCSATLQNAQLC